MAVPRDFLAEIEAELESARRRLRESAEVWAALEELRDRTLTVSRRLRRPVTVFDVFRAAANDEERDRVAALVRELRSRNRAG